MTAQPFGSPVRWTSHRPPRWPTSAEALVDRPLTCAVIDLDLLTFIDCSGLDRLIAYRARLEASNISVTFVNPNPAVLKLLRLTGLETTLVDGIAGLATRSTSDR